MEVNEQRREAYLNLIQALLSCSSGEEASNLLNANGELIDAGLVQTMEQVSAWLAEQGDQNNATWLQSVATQLEAAVSNSSPIATAEETYSFLFEVLRAVANSNGEPQVVYPLLQANLNKLDLRFAQLLSNWATAKFTEVEPEQATAIAAIVFVFSDLIQQFPLGNTADNIEAAVAGYQVALQVYTRTVFPVDWATIQNNLGNAYSNRIWGEPGQNLEDAIHYYQQALLERSRERHDVCEEFISCRG